MFQEYILGNYIRKIILMDLSFIFHSNQIELFCTNIKYIGLKESFINLISNLDWITMYQRGTIANKFILFVYT